MKKTTLFLLALFIIPVFAGAFDLGQNSEIQKQLAQELNTLQQNTCNLYGIVEKELLKYYGKSNIQDFYDPEHKTGWFRVYDFLTWLKENEKDLTDKFSEEANAYNNHQYHTNLRHPLAKYCSLKTRELRGVLGVYLGKEYLLSKYLKDSNIKCDFVQIEKTKCGSGSANCRDVSIAFNKEKAVSFTHFVNLGIHENMHLLGIITSDDEKAITEDFTVFAQMAYGLPIKIEDEKFFPFGVRDLYNDINLYPGVEKAEYTNAFYAYIQFKGLSQLGIQDVISFSQSISKYNEEIVRDSFLPIFNQRMGKNFFKNLLKINVNEVRMTEILKQNEYNIGMLVGKDALLTWLCMRMPEVSVEKKDSSFYVYEKGEEDYTFYITPVDVKEYVDSFAILPEYKEVFENIANEYIKTVLDSFYENDLKKYSRIKTFPLKYILKKNEDIPPVPEGYM